jgi:hypothetical protein
VGDIEAERASAKLGSPDGATSAKAAEKLVPSQPGLYSLFVDKATSLPGIYGEELVGRETTLLYIGKAATSLVSRLVEQDLCHRSPSTFFRAIGPILGFRPVSGSLAGKSNQNNYKFSRTDTDSIASWISSHLLVKWVLHSSPETIEPWVIGEHAPLLNTIYNPRPLPELAALRKECRQISQRVSEACPMPSADGPIVVAKHGRGRPGKYTAMWESLLPTIRAALAKCDPPQGVILDRAALEQLGRRKSYTFRISYSRGNVTNNLGGSAIARDLDRVLRSDEELQASFRYMTSSLG